MSSTTKSRIPRRPPRRHRTTIKPPLPPDPAITPTTMKGNYPARPSGPPSPGRNPGTDSASLTPAGRKRQPSNTPYTKTWPRQRDTSQPDILDRIKALLLRFIDWLNGRTGAAEDDKRIADGEHMATLAELFDEVERPRPPRPGQMPGNTSTSR